MKKNIFKFFSIAIAFFLFSSNVNAGSLNISASNTSPYVGGNVIITVKTNSLAGKFSVSSSNSGVLSGGGVEDWIEGTVTYTFTAKSVGTATVTVRPVDVADYDGNVYTNSQSVTINVRSNSGSSSNSENNSSGNSSNSGNTSNNKNLSSNNYLSAFSIDGATLNPTFNKNTLEYSIELKSKTTEITLNATAEDSKSKITGTGKISVNEGINTIEVVVTAENGSTKTYTIKATVKELDPINVTVDGEKYTVVRKKELLKIPDNYKETTVKINDQDVPALYSNSTKLTLVGLKNSDGTIELYIYDSNKETYKYYNELKFKNVTLLLLDMDEELLPKGYIKSDSSIEGKKIVAYKLSSSSKFSLVYGMNVETGETSLYMYDSVEQTLQRYNDEEIINLNNTIENYKMFIYCLFGVIGLLLLILLIIFIVSKKKKKKNKSDDYSAKHVENDEEESKPKYLSETKLDTLEKKEMDKIEDDKSLETEESGTDIKEEDTNEISEKEQEKLMKILNKQKEKKQKKLEKEEIKRLKKIANDKKKRPYDDMEQI